MAGVSKCVIKRVDNLEGSTLNPFIVEFQNGTLQDEAARDLQCGIYVNKRSKRKCVAVKDSNMYYMGNEDTNEICQNFIAIRNRSTNEVRLVSASTALLAPVLHTKKKTKDKDSQNLEYNEQLKSLTKIFGPKARFKALEQQDRIKAGHNAVKNQLESSINKVNVNDEDIVTSSGIGYFIKSLPPCDRNAMHVRDVYKVEDIVSAAEIEELKSEARRVLERGEEEIDDSCYKYSALYKLILKHILSVKKLSDEEKIEKIAILTYSEYIIVLLSAKPRHLRQKNFEVCPVSSLVNKRLLDTFTLETSNGRAHTMEMTDKSICYVLILSLLLHRRKVPLKQLLASFNCKSQQLSMLCQAVGATELVEEGVRYATLKLPLPVIPMNQRVGKGLMKRKK